MQLTCQPGREKMGNPRMRFPGNFTSSREIFTDFQKKKIVEVFVVNRQSSYLKARPTH